MTLHLAHRTTPPSLPLSDDSTSVDAAPPISGVRTYRRSDGDHDVREAAVHRAQAYLAAVTTARGIQPMIRLDTGGDGGDEALSSMIALRLSCRGVGTRAIVSRSATLVRRYEEHGR